jgi:hypothetical protein
MLVARCCPYTGVVNLFADAEPHLAIGSLVRADVALCHWRCYVGPPAGGAAPDMHSARRQLVGRYRQVLRAAVSARRRAGEGRRFAGRAGCTPQLLVPHA